MRTQHSLLLVPLIIAGTASAQTVDLALAGYQTDYTVYVNTQGANDSPDNVYSTLQTLMTSSQGGGLSLPSEISLFCVELGQPAPTSPTQYSLLGSSASDGVQGSSDTRGQLDTLAGIGTAGIGATRAANLEYLYGYAFGGGYSLQGDLNQAVFQMAVWQLSHSDSFTLSSDSTGFYFSNPSNSSLIGDTQTLLTEVYNHESSITPQGLEVLQSDVAQDYLLPVDASGNFIPIPEPTVWAAAVGLVALVYALLHRRAATAR